MEEEVKTEEAKQEEVKESKKEKKHDSKKDHKEELESAKNKILELEDKNVRLQAEFMNYRTRTESEITNMFKYEGENTIKELLEVVDDFERAIKMDDNDLTDEVSNFLKGFKMIYTRIITILDKLEVKAVEVEGKEFDPNFAEAVLTEHDENKPENVVLEVLKKGYMYKDKLIRPAMVKVNK